MLLMEIKNIDSEAAKDLRLGRSFIFEQDDPIHRVTATINSLDQ